MVLPVFFKGVALQILTGGDSVYVRGHVVTSRRLTGIGLVGEDRVGRSDIVQRKGWFLPQRTSQFKMSIMPKLVNLPLRQQAGLLGTSGLSW